MFLGVMEEGGRGGGCVPGLPLPLSKVKWALGDISVPSGLPFGCIPQAGQERHNPT